MPWPPILPFAHLSYCHNSRELTSCLPLPYNNLQIHIPKSPLWFSFSPCALSPCSSCNLICLSKVCLSQLYKSIWAPRWEKMHQGHVLLLWPTAQRRIILLRKWFSKCRASYVTYSFFKLCEGGWDKLYLADNTGLQNKFTLCWTEATSDNWNIWRQLRKTGTC